MQSTDLLKTYLKKHQPIALLTAALVLSSCSSIALKPEPQVVVQTEYISKKIPVQEPPKQVNMPSVDWYVVSEGNLQDFLDRLKRENGAVAFMAISPKGYENLSVGIGELRRYILQQKEIIVYYEKAISEKPEEINKPEEEAKGN